MRKFLGNNEDSMVTALDVHETLKYLMQKDFNISDSATFAPPRRKTAYNLMKDLIPKGKSSLVLMVLDRTCQQAGVLTGWCICEPYHRSHWTLLLFLVLPLWILGWWANMWMRRRREKEQRRKQKQIAALENVKVPGRIELTKSIQ